ncbi:OprD family porin [Halopseudomonas salegens]|uniref:Imipenem/basic amino acid-specific outer membrane pore n=1 Tax=Halopseudomonas salegens TaxID=1434072 RepID=A0A1H2G2A0_9GAMM|nr:OprD family porin [Halopseudomonas salegens]SDU13645.1 imipenem/basic amino acid-specific outer membrane pore [Halopseudomonas salegens]
MKNAIKWSSVALAVAMGNSLIAAQATAGEGFVEGASADLKSRTMYFNRDFRSSGSAGKREEAAQGFVLDFKSGYTQGAVGFGADVVAMAGIKLDSSRSRAGTGLLELDSTGRAESEYAEIRGALKLRIAEDTEFRYGVHFPTNPVVAYDDARLLPNHYSGYSVTNSSVDGLFLEAGRMDKRGPMGDSGELDSVSTFEDSDDLYYVGGTYAFNDNLSASLYTSEIDDAWERHFVGVTHTLELSGDLSLTTDLAHYQTSDESGPASNYDNDATSLALTLGAGHHALTWAHQRMDGDTGYAYDDGAVFLANSVQYLDFNAKDERSYQLRYDYDFAGIGIPGLTFMTRYIRGENIDIVGRDTRWERDTNISYTVQNGALEGLNLLWRNATVRQDTNLDGGDVDENRVIVSYSWNLL